MREFWFNLTGGKTVNGRALLILLAGVVVGGAGLFFLHRFQLRRNAEGAYEQAKIAEAKGDKALAVHYLQQFLGMDPSHTDALAKLGTLLNEQAASARARTRVFLIFEQVLRRDTERQDIRREVVRLASQLGRFNDGLEHLKILMPDPAKTDDVELLQLRARCEAGLGHDKDAVDFYKQALAAGPQQPDIVLEYASLLRGRLKLQTAADAAVEQMVIRDKRSPGVRLKAASYFVVFGMPKRAEEHLRFALDELGPPTADVLHLAGDVALRLGEPDEARKLFEQGRQLFPDDQRMSRGLAEVEVRQGDAAKALAHLKRNMEPLPKSPIELWELGDLLLKAESLDQARVVIAELRKQGHVGLVALLEARIQMHEEQWGDALKTLDRARLARQIPAGFSKHADFLIAGCADRLLNPDLHLEAVKRVVDSDPNWLQGATAYARALAATGKLDLAVAELRRLAAQAPLAKLDLARMLMGRLLRQPAPQRDWSEVKSLLAELPTEARDRLDTKLLRAEVAVLEGDHAGARTLAEAERQRDPKQVTPWLFLVALEERNDRPAARTLLDEAEKQVGRRVDWEIARLRIAMQAGPAEGRNELAKLLKALDGYEKIEQRNRLLEALAGASVSLGDLPGARRLWSELAQHAPGNLAVWLALFDAALEAKDADEARRVLDRIRKLEGGDGPHTACSEAALLLAGLAESPGSTSSSPGAADKAMLAEVRKHLARARTARPSWSRVPLLEATVLEREGRVGEALEKYKAAIDRGESRLSVIQRTVRLMYDQKSFGEAQALLQKLPERALTAPGLGRLAAHVTLESQRQAGEEPEVARRQALEVARKAVAKSTDHRDFIWLGQMAAAAGEKQEAEKALRRAVELDSTAPECWIALVVFLAQSGGKDGVGQAETELENAKKKLTGELAPLAIGTCYEALGKLPLAEEQYQAALKARPRDIVVLKNAAGFYGRTGQFAKAEPLLRQCLDLPEGLREPTATWARRNLALALTFQGGYQRLQEAQAVLGSNLEVHDHPEDRLIKALTLATHPSHRKEAIELIEDAGRRSKGLPVNFRLLLAQLYEADGDWDKARRELVELARGHDKNAVVLGQLIRALLRHGKAAEAAPWTEKLAAVAPGKPETIDLQVQVLKGTGAKAKAVELVSAYVKEKDARLDLAARWLESLGEPAAAEKHYRAFATSGLAANPKQPENVLSLAMFLGRQKRLPEALAVCQEAWKTCRPETVASASISLLRMGEPGADAKKQVQRAVLEAIRQNPKSRALPLLLSELYDLGGEHDRAIAILRDMHKQDARNVVILNNLAYLVAVRQGDPAAALPLIDEAIMIAGPVDELLDTRATIHLKNSQPDRAVKDLEQALAQTATATRYFHLAQARQMAKDRAAAATALRQALDMGLQASQVHPLEREAFKQLVADLN